MRHLSTLCACAAVMALSVVTACASPGHGPRIEPITVAGADDRATTGVEADVGRDVDSGGDGGADSGADSGGGSDSGSADAHAEVVGGSGGAGDGAGDDPPGPGPAGTRGAAIDITTVPDEITPAYVEAVLAALEALYAGALASHVAAGEPTLETTTKLGSVFTEPAYAGRLEHFIQIGQQGFVEIAAADRIRPRTHTDVRLLVVEDDCIYAETRLDLSPVRKEPRPVEVAFVHLVSRDREIFHDVNPTPWLIHRMPTGDDELLRGWDRCAA